MCTVTYLPTQSGFILTHNRDEAPTRSPDRISNKMLPNGNRLYWPPDTAAGGAWIGITQKGHAACLLNGAFLKHQHNPPYRRSRGLILLDFFEQPDSFLEEIELDLIEPFTLLSFEPERCSEFRWDGARKYLETLNPKETRFWCSATLYPPDMQILRREVFQSWLQNHPESPNWPTEIRQLHHAGSVGDPENDYVMNRQNRVRTVSITQITRSTQQACMQYENLLDQQTDTQHIDLINGQ